MKISSIFQCGCGATIAVASAVERPLVNDHTGDYLFSNPPANVDAGFRIPTSYESAVMARRILALTPLGTLSTVFPSSSQPIDAVENRPAGLGGMSIGLMDYIADCEGESGNPTILAIKIATSFKNVRDGSNISLSLDWTPPYPPSKRISLRSWLGLAASDPQLPYSAANLPRFSLLGYLEPIDIAESQEASGTKERPDQELVDCFVKTHPDAKYWLPGNRIHAAEWVRLVVQQVYWIGGFGDRAYIGWIPVEEWRNVTRAEWESIRLPGEKKGWKEWAVGSSWLGQDDL